ncbi:MAG: DUF4013 domain-containing protein [Chloroflexota bacterium]
MNENMAENKLPNEQDKKALGFFEFFFNSIRNWISLGQAKEQTINATQFGKGVAQSGMDALQKGVRSTTKTVNNKVEEVKKSIEAEGNENEALNYLKSLVFPFSEKQWPLRIFMAWVIGLIPGLNLILYRGWRLDLVRRISNKQADRLPQVRNVGQMLVDGCILWMMTLVYSIPLILMIVVVGMGQLTILLEIGWWLLAKLTGWFESELTGIIAAQMFLGLAAEMTMPALYAIFVGPIYRAGMIQYALTGQKRSFFKIWSNIQAVYTNMSGYGFVYVIDKLISGPLMLSLVSTVSTALVATVFGAVLVPFAAPIILLIHYWSTGYLMGLLSIRHEEKTSTGEIAY